MQKQLAIRLLILTLVLSWQAVSYSQDEQSTRNGVKKTLQDQDSGSQNSADKTNNQNQAAAGKNATQDPQPQNSSQSQDNSQTQGDSQGTADSNTSPVVAPSPAANTALAAYLSTPRRRRLGRQPRMFGDWFTSGATVFVSTETPTPSTGLDSAVGLPSAGGGRVGKISENNSALPYDRVFVNYNYFHNAIGQWSTGPDAQRSLANISVDRWTVGFEKTFFDGLTSIETRFILSDVPDFGHNPVDRGRNGFQTSNATIGNLAFVSKFLIFENDSTAIAAGAALELPTGGDAFVKSGLTRLELENQAIYISPYIGILKKPTDSPWFANFFVQIETPLSGDGVTISDLTTTNADFLGRLNPQTNLFVDLGIGRWLYQNPNTSISGLAAFFEAHYNTALNDADQIEGANDSGGFSSDFLIASGSNNYDVVDLSVGLHIEFFQQTKLRIGGVFPVSNDRAFDGELGIQLTRNLGN